MAYRFEANAPIEENIHRILNEQLDKAHRQLFDTFDQAPADAIHDARKRFKKGRSVLRLVKPSLDKGVYKREKNALRHIGRILAPARDGEAYQETLNVLLERYAQVININAFSAMQAILRDYQQAKLYELMSDGEPMTTVRSTLKNSAIRLHELPLNASGWDAISGGLERIYRQGKQRLEFAYEEGSDHAFHEWRKRVKDLWYDMRLLRSVWPPVMNALQSEAHQLSKRLGDDHDIAELRKFLLNRESVLSPSISLETLLPLMDDYQGHLRQKAYGLGRRLYAEESSAFVERIESYWHVWFEA